MTPGTLVAAVGCTPALAVRYAEHLAEACALFDITGPARQAAFLAQLGHESGSFRHAREIWGPTPQQARYEGRRDLGNTQPGDGSRFRGRGLIQTTGRDNYQRLRDRLRARLGDCPDFVAEPEALEQPRWAALSAGDYWDEHGLNALADAGQIVQLGRAINRGDRNSTKPANGEADRMARHARAMAALAAPGDLPTLAPIPATTEASMPLPAIAAALLPTLIKSLPMLSEMFGSGSEVQERNVKAAGMVLDVVQEAVGARNTQEAVELIQANPEARQQAEDAVRASWFDIQRSIADARVFAVSYAQTKDVRTVAGSLTFLELLSMILVCSSLIGGFSAIMWGDLSPELDGAIITLILIGGFTGVREFWFGSSMGSKSKDSARDAAPN